VTTTGLPESQAFYMVGPIEEAVEEKPRRFQLGAHQCQIPYTSDVVSAEESIFSGEGGVRRAAGASWASWESIRRQHAAHHAHQTRLGCASKVPGQTEEGARCSSPAACSKCSRAWVTVLADTAISRVTISTRAKATRSAAARARDAAQNRSSQDGLRQKR